MRLIALGLVLALVGCKTTTEIVTNTVVIEPPSALYNCPNAPRPPNQSHMTNQDVIDYIEDLRQSLIICKVNMNKIEEYVTRARITLEREK